ncbi:MAG: M23 family metallopeptidase [Lysobacterales bacterium]|jgi:murein DD-endopeptidase MepM/ murein hydrolase activator NlpD
MKKRAAVAVLLMLGTALSFGAPAAGSAAIEAPPVAMDGRFSGFDAIGDIRRNHPRLAPWAESVSHWAGYYSVNPLLLALVLEERIGQQPLTLDSIRKAALGLAALPEQRTSAQLASLIGSTYGLAADTSSKLVETARQESAATRLMQPLAVVSDTPPALDLPFSRPQNWQFNGVHTWTGDDDGSAMSSIDFVRGWSIEWGDDTSEDWVSAAHDGEVTVFSSCFVQIQHDNGWATRYYHMDNLQVETGQRVRAGDLLGNYANDQDQALCSGGHSSGPHVHFALQKDGLYFSLSDKALSGYLVHPGENSYDASHEHMWLEKRDERYYAYGPGIGQQEGDNTIDYRYNGMWYSPEHNGHGLNVEVTEFAGEDEPRKTVFVVMYTYDDAGEANFYVGNRDYDRWRSDESMVIDMLQTSGGNFSDLSPVDFENPAEVTPAGQLEIRFFDCMSAEVNLDLDERVTGQPSLHSISLVKLIGVPDHVCAEASLPLPD